MAAGDPSLAIQKAILDALKGNTDAGDSVFDTPSPSDPYPRIVIGEGLVLGNFADCYEGSESSVTITVWSRDVGFPEAKRIASQVRSLIHDAELPLTGHTLELLEFQSAQALRDPDGLTRRVDMTFRLLTQPEEET
jgi:hypothetical protein